MSLNREKAELDRSFWIASVLSILSMLVSIISILDDDAVLFALFLIICFAFGFYAFWKWDKVKKASYYRILEDDKRKARGLLSRGTKHRFSRNKKIGLPVSILSFVISIIFISYEEFMLFALFLIISVISAIIVLMSGKYLDDPYSYFRAQRPRYNYPGRYKGNAHKKLLVSTIVFLGLFVVLEYTLDFDNMIDWWISGFVGVIGVTLIFITIAAWPKKYVKLPEDLVDR